MIPPMLSTLSVQQINDLFISSHQKHASVLKAEKLSDQSISTSAVVPSSTHSMNHFYENAKVAENFPSFRSTCELWVSFANRQQFQHNRLLPLPVSPHSAYRLALKRQNLTVGSSKRRFRDQCHIVRFDVSSEAYEIHLKYTFFVN